MRIFQQITTNKAHVLLVISVLFNKQRYEFFSKSQLVDYAAFHVVGCMAV